MKIVMTESEWNSLPQGVQSFIIDWKRKKRYSSASPQLTLGEAVELCIAVGFDFHHDDILHGTYNNVLELNDGTIGWDSDHLLDDLVYDLVQNIKRRLAHTYNSPIDEFIGE